MAETLIDVLPAAMTGPRIQKVFEERGGATGKPLKEVRSEARAAQWIARLVDLNYIPALAVFPRFRRGEVNPWSDVCRPLKAKKNLAALGSKSASALVGR